MNETHFVVNMYHVKMLGFVGDEEFKYCNVISGGQGITMFLQITVDHNSNIHPPWLFSKTVLARAPFEGWIQMYW